MSEIAEQTPPAADGPSPAAAGPPPATAKGLQPAAEGPPPAAAGQAGVAAPAPVVQPALTDPFEIGGVAIGNRVLLAPLAGIGNWFVRLQARRHGAGLAVSEMVSSFGLHHRNERTLRELMRIHPEEHPVSIQLFGHDAEVMRSAAATAAEAGADLIDINMGCPVRKVCKTGAGAALIEDPDLALGLVRGAREGSGLPVTVKVRSGLRVGDTSGYDLAIRLVEEAGAAAVGFHPRAATAGHAGRPDYERTRRLAERLTVPVIVSGGLRSAEAARHAYLASGADAVMIARGALGNPWVFEQLTGRRADAGPGPTPDEVATELLWVIDRAEEHLGSERAARYLRKFYPWYMEWLEPPRELADELQRDADLPRARAIVDTLAKDATTTTSASAGNEALTAAGREVFTAAGREAVVTG